MRDVNYVDEQPGAPAPPPAYGPPQQQAKSGSTVLIVVLGVVVGLVVLVGVLASLAIYGVRSYLVKAKAAEGLHTSASIGRSIAACGEPLPPTSSPVPTTPPAGSKYMSSRSDWTQPAFSCGGGFHMAAPQYFSYQWVRESSSRGRVVALADLDGDGSAEVRMEVVVECAAGSCNAGPATGAP